MAAGLKDDKSDLASQVRWADCLKQGTAEWVLLRQTEFQNCVIILAVASFGIDSVIDRSQERYGRYSIRHEGH